MKRCETLAELIARTVVEFEQRELELQKAQMQPQKKVLRSVNLKKLLSVNIVVQLLLPGCHLPIFF